MAFVQRYFVAFRKSAVRLGTYWYLILLLILVSFAERFGQSSGYNPLGVSVLLTILKYFLLLVSFSLPLAIPAFFDEKKQLSLERAYQLVSGAAKRALVPIIIIAVGSVVVFGLFVALAGRFFAPGNLSGRESITWILNQLTLLVTTYSTRNNIPILPSLPLNTIAALFAVTPLFFTLEKKGYFRSLALSVKYGITHVELLGGVIILESLLSGIQWVIFYFADLQTGLYLVVPFAAVMEIWVASYSYNFWRLHPPSSRR